MNDRKFTSVSNERYFGIVMFQGSENANGSMGQIASQVSFGFNSYLRENAMPVKIKSVPLNSCGSVTDDCERHVFSAMEEFNSDDKCVAILVSNDPLFDIVNKWDMGSKLKKPLITTVVGNVDDHFKSKWMFHCWTPQVQILSKELAKFSHRLLARETTPKACVLMASTDRYCQNAAAVFSKYFCAVSGGKCEHLAWAENNKRFLQDQDIFQIVFVVGFGELYGGILAALRNYSGIIVADTTVSNAEIKNSRENYLKNLRNLYYIDVPDYTQNEKYAKIFGQFVSESASTSAASLSVETSNQLYVSKVAVACHDMLDFAFSRYKDSKRGADSYYDLLVKTKCFKSTLGTLLFQDHQAFLPQAIFKYDTSREAFYQYTPLYRKDTERIALSQILEIIDDVMPQISKKTIDLRLDSTELKTVIATIASKIKEVFTTSHIRFIVKHKGLVSPKTFSEQGEEIDNTGDIVASHILCQMKKKHPIQINLGDDDFEDNDAYRIYIVERQIDGSTPIFPLYFFLQKHKTDGIDAKKIQAIILAKTEYGAEYLLNQYFSTDRNSSQQQKKTATYYPDTQLAMGDLVFINDFLEFPNTQYTQNIVHNGEFISIFFEWIQKILRTNEKHLFLIPEVTSSQSIETESRKNIDFNSDQTCYIVLTVPEKLAYLDVSILTTVATRLFAPLHGTLYLHEITATYVKAAITALMSRNMSHNLGSHVITNAKHQIEDLENQQGDDKVKEQLRGVSVLMQYLQERQDFIAVIANDEHYPKGPLNFKSAVFDLLAMDGPSYRHGLEAKVNNYILDNIVRSENIVRRGSLSGNADSNTLNIELQLVKVDATGKTSAFKSIDEREIGTEFSGLTLSVNNGLNGRQALLIILENMIRNSAKHDKDSLNRLENKTLLFSIIFKECRDETTGNAYYDITIADNKKNFGSLKPKFEKLDDNNTPIIKDGKLAPLRILREDSGGIAKDNKGIKEILISLAWLKYGELGKSGKVEIDYDTLQNEPWEIMDVVGVDDRFAVYDYDAPNQPSGLSLGYRFRLDKYKSVHLLSREELQLGNKSLREALADLPGASLYAVRESLVNEMADNKILSAIPRWEKVPDNETEESLAKRLDVLLEKNIKNRFGVSTLPYLRISENVKHPYNDWDKKAIVRDLLGKTGEENWEREHAGEGFIHYRTHYETILTNAANDAALDLKPHAIFTEGISGGNFTHTLIRSDISRHSYLRIVEAALVRIAIVDERIFAKCGGRTPKQRQENPTSPDKAIWKYWEQKGVHILSSDADGVFDLRGYHISTGVIPSVKYDFLTIHLGLIDKTDAGENATEAEKLNAVLLQFGGRYALGKTKLSIHSGRGGMTQVEDAAFVPLSGIEWALDNCKYTLSEFFHGIKYPVFATTARHPLPLAPVTPQKQIDFSPPPETKTVPETPATATEDNKSENDALPYNSNTRKLFLFTTYSTDSSCLYGKATGTIENPEVEKFVSWETIHEKAPAFVEQFKCITHIDSQVFFYPCTKPLNKVIIPLDRHSEFICHLVGKILEATSSNEAVELHLILHASDTPVRRVPNTKDTAHLLIKEIKQAYQGKVFNATIWWFSHDGYGIHRNIICNGEFFEDVDDKALHLLKELASHTNTRPPITSATPKARAFPAASERYGYKPKMPVVEEQDICPVLRVPDNFQLNNKTYLNCLAIWQLNGAEDQSSLDAIFESPDDDVFWSPRFSPERCAERINNPKPLLVIGSKPLKEFGKEERRANYVDSSIWCRYACNEQEAMDIRKQFVHNREMGLYDCNNAREYLEFWGRMLINSRLGELESSGHRKIAPIVFHSEREMAAKTAKSIKQIKDVFALHSSSNRPLIWKILLVDDHSREHLSGGNCSKMTVICDVLSTIFSIEVFDDGKYVRYPSKSQPELDGLCHIKIHCVATKDEAMTFIKQQKFDIILLDYLLNKPKTRTAIDDFDTSDELLEEIRMSTNEHERGPMGYLWVFNVSAFARAIDGKLTAKGLQYHTNEWHLDKGACPINTPELFKYNLLSFMTWQVDELVRFHRKKFPGHDNARSLIDLLSKIFMSEDNIPRQADKYFRSILNFEADCKIMWEDVRYGLSDKDVTDIKTIVSNPQKSEIVFSLFPDIVYYDEPFWDHLSHLIHTTAYGSPQQWPQMLVNFREIKSTLLDANKGRNEQESMELVKKIEEHIIDLHS